MIGSNQLLMFVKPTLYEDTIVTDNVLLGFVLNAYIDIITS